MEQKKICIFGDSIVWGKADYDNCGWANFLWKYFTKEGTVLVYPLGIPGDTTEFLLERFEAEAESRESDIITFAIGFNDCCVDKDGNFAVGIDKFRDNLDKLIKQARKFTKKIIFVGLFKVDEAKTLPTGWDDTLYYYNKNILEYNSATEATAKDKNCLFVDLMNEISIEDLDDGLHPNTEGHGKIFEKVKQKVENLIKKK